MRGLLTRWKVSLAEVAQTAGNGCGVYRATCIPLFNLFDDLAGKSLFAAQRHVRFKEAPKKCEIHDLLTIDRWQACEFRSVLRQPFVSVHTCLQSALSQRNRSDLECYFCCNRAHASARPCVAASRPRVSFFRNAG